MAEIEDLFVYDDSLDEYWNNYYEREGKKQLEEIVENAIEYWNYREVAIYLGVTERSVKRYVAEKKIAIHHRAEDRYNTPYFNSLEIIEFHWSRINKKKKVENDKDLKSLMQEIHDMSCYNAILDDMQD